MGPRAFREHDRRSIVGTEGHQRRHSDAALAQGPPVFEFSGNTTAAPTRAPQITNGGTPKAALAQGLPVLAAAAAVSCKGWLA